MSLLAALTFIQNALPLFIKSGLALQEAWQLSSSLFYMGWTFTVTDNDSFYFCTLHSAERHPQIQLCHSGRLPHQESSLLKTKELAEIWWTRTQHRLTLS